MPGHVLSIVFYMCLFVVEMAQAICPSGFSVETGATGGIIATETTAAADRVRCTSTNHTNRQVYEYMQTTALCSGTTVQCSTRCSRCTAPDKDVLVVGLHSYCRSCDAGSTRIGQNCQNCASNTYRQLHAANVCVRYAAGKFSSECSTNANNCGDDDCQQCDRGSYAPNAGSIQCELCPAPAGSYATTEGPSLCTTCPGSAPALPQPLNVCSMQHFAVRIGANVPAATGTIYTRHNNNIWFHMSNNSIGLRHILNSMRQDWNLGDSLFITSALGQPQLLNPTALQCIHRVDQGKWSLTNVNPVHSSNATRYVLVYNN